MSIASRKLGRPMKHIGRKTHLLTVSDEGTRPVIKATIRRGAERRLTHRETHGSRRMGREIHVPESYCLSDGNGNSLQDGRRKGLLHEVSPT